MKKLLEFLCSFTVAFSIASASTGAGAQESALASEVASLRTTRDVWRRIPWRTCLQEARAEAHQRGRPLLVWALGGDPSGRC